MTMTGRQATAHKLNSLRDNPLDLRVWSEGSLARWQTKRLKFVSRLAYGSSLPDEKRDPDGGVEVYGSNGSIGFHNISITDGKTIVIGRKGSYGKITWVNQSCFPVDTTYFIDSTQTTQDLRWLFYLLLCLRLDEGNQDTGVPGLARESAYSLLVPVPPLEEQHVIARFLDRKTALVDEVIAKKQKLIALLKEKRQALITQAATKGLDPNVKLKPSGIDWLGDIPETWEVKRLKYVSRTRVSNVDKKSEDDNVVRLCNYVDVYKNEFITDDIDFMSATATLGQIEAFGLQFGDVLITKDSETPDDIGIPALVTAENLSSLVCGYHLAIITPDAVSFLGGYLFRLLQCKKYGAYFEVNCNGVTRFGLSMYPILNMEVLIPPRREQQEIIDFIGQQTAKIDSIIERARSQVTKLREYRQALITAAVTGKIMVE